MEGEVVALKKVLAVFMAVVVICNVYVYGTGQRFSFEKYINGIAKSFSELPTIQDLVDIWTSEEKNGIGGGSGHAGGRSSSESEDSERTGFFEAVLDFFEGIGDFFGRLWDSVLFFVDALVSIFAILPCLLPWNAAVSIE